MKPCPRFLAIIPPLVKLPLLASCILKRSLTVFLLPFSICVPILGNTSATSAGNSDALAPRESDQGLGGPINWLSWKMWLAVSAGFGIKKVFGGRFVARRGRGKGRATRPLRTK